MGADCIIELLKCRRAATFRPLVGKALVKTHVCSLSLWIQTQSDLTFAKRFADATACRAVSGGFWHATQIEHQVLLHYSQSLLTC
jgi:hypothetical protein